MAESQQGLIRQQHGLRVGSEMAAYAFRQAARQTDGAPVPVIGRDARTGRPVARQLPADALRKAARENA